MNPWRYSHIGLRQNIWASQEDNVLVLLDGQGGQVGGVMIITPGKWCHHSGVMDSPFKRICSGLFLFSSKSYQNLLMM
jgi:hypothetical protein